MFTLPEKSNLNSQRGFTLIEAMVALVILTVALIPALYLSDTAVNASTVIRDDTVAAGLSQEGIEVVRAIRDANWFAGRAFNTGLANGTYRVEWDSAALIPLGANPPLKIDNGLYTYASGTTSQFYRTIAITNVNSGEIKVVSTVTWTTRGGDVKTVSAEDHLFDWK